MKNKIEWLFVAIMTITGLCMVSMLFWATLVGTWHFILAFLTTLGAKFVYFFSAFLIALFGVIKCAEDQPQMNSK